MKICAYCARENEGAAEYCRKCGTADFRVADAQRPESFLKRLLPGYRRSRRQQLLARPFPEHWESFLRLDVAHYRLLSAAAQSRLKDILRILIDEKNWEGCDGLQVSSEMKVTIAAEAALMLLGLDHDYF